MHYILVSFESSCKAPWTWRKWRRKM